MNEKQYLISESELKELIVHHSVYQDNVINDFLDTKQPVKTLNREEVEKIIWELHDSLKCWLQNEAGTPEQNNAYIEDNIYQTVTAICNLVPDDFELVASGRYMTDCMVLKFEGYPEPDEKVTCKEYSGKKVLIYIKERKE
jgi:hypothetical protein